MSVSMKPLLALLATPAVLAIFAMAGTPVAAAAKPTGHVVPATRIGTIDLGVDGGWSTTIDVMFARRRKLTSIGVDARGPGHQSLQYGIHGRAEPDGTIDAHLPGVGRIALRFEATGEKKIHAVKQAQCTLLGRSVEREGVFRGTIDLHDQTGAIEIVRHSAPGKISVFPAEACPGRKPKPHREPPPELPTELGHVTQLVAGRTVDGGTVSLDATSFELIGTRTPIAFSASYFHLRHGMTTFAGVQGSGTARDFTVSPPTGTPSEATLTPPAPFAGTAAFKLESPTAASWTGDLRVRIPILGEVNLAGPGFWSVLCEDNTCSATAPPGVQVSILGFR